MGNEQQTTWLQFLPDLTVALIGGIATGFVVGLILWWFQRAAERRAVIRRTTEEWTVVESKVRRAMTREFTRNMDSLEILGSRADQILEIAEKYPTRMWQKQIISPILQATIDLETAIEATRVYGNRLELTLKTACIAAVGGTNAAELVRYIRSILYGFDDEQYQQWSSQPTEAVSQIRQFADVVVSTPEVLQDTEKYDLARKHMDRTADVLLEALGMPPSHG